MDSELSWAKWCEKAVEQVAIEHADEQRRSS